MKHRNARTAESVARFWGKTLRAEDRNWYSVKMAADGSAEIRIYDVIGWPFVTADEFVQDLNGITADRITVAINSPGGDVFDGTAIFNALRAHPAHVTTRIDGLAASMASVIALAGDEVQMADNAYYMIHNPWTFMAGDEHGLRKEADLLGRIGNTLASTYAKKTGKSQDEIKAMMDEETWLIGGEEAKDAGFIDTITGEAKASAHFDLGMFAHAPNALKSAPRDYAENPPSEREFERLLRDAGFSRSRAAAITARGYKGIGQRDADEEALTATRKLINTLSQGVSNV